MKDEHFDMVMEQLQTEYGWDWTTTPDEKKLTADIINDTIKAVKKIFLIKKDMNQPVAEILRALVMREINTVDAREKILSLFKYELK